MRSSFQYGCVMIIDSQLVSDLYLKRIGICKHKKFYLYVPLSSKVSAQLNGISFDRLYMRQ